MARISGVDLPNDKRVVIGLTYIYGIGNTTAEQIITATGVDPDTRCSYNLISSCIANTINISTANCNSFVIR